MSQFFVADGLRSMMVRSKGLEPVAELYVNQRETIRSVEASPLTTVGNICNNALGTDE